MAHEVENMMYVGEEPWHGLGKAIPKGKELSIEEAIVAAGLNWEVGLKHLYTEDRIGIHGYYATYRKSDNTILGVVGSDYRPLQNREAFNWSQPFLDVKVAALETAGSLKGGKVVWILAKIKNSLLRIVKGDEVENYILLSNSHDGSLAVRAGFTPIRVVCNNTLCKAHESEASKLLRVKHTARVVDNLESIREIMNLAQKEFIATIEQFRALASKNINTSDLEKYVRVVFDLKEDSKSKKVVPSVVALFESGRGSKEAGRTYWGAYNAVTEYLNYFRGKNQDNRLDSLWFGNGSQINQKALNSALDMAKAA